MPVPPARMTASPRCKTLAAVSIDKGQEVRHLLRLLPVGTLPQCTAAAWRTLKELGFTNLKVLYIQTNFGADWVEKSYPTVKG